MGAGQSKEELLYQEVQNGNHDAVKALRRNGTSMEWVDKEGRTPLILACTRGELLDMAITLLNLGANIDAYRPGAHRGTPLHHAAKRGLEKTVTLLLSRGANPLTINDEGLTPLQMARSRGHVSVVRILEEQLCLFSGMLREISGFSFFETIARTLVTKRIWAVVLPTETHSRRPPKYELAVYPSIKVPQPKTLISLAAAEIEEPKFNTTDPVLYITDKPSKTKYRFLSDHEGDKAQLERLYEACRGVPQISLAAASGQLGNASQNLPVGLQGSGMATPVRQPVLQSSSSDASRPVNQTGTEPSEPNDYNGWDTQAGSNNGWGPPDGGENSEKQPKKTSYGGWEGDQSTYNGWGPSEAGPSRRPNKSSNQQTTTASLVQPSAPPIPEGPIDYPSIDMMQTGPGPLIGSQNPDPNIMTDDKAGGMCVICWDAPAEGACVPCGHLAGCMDCLSEVKAKNWGCPVCREQIQQVVKVFAV